MKKFNIIKTSLIVISAVALASCDWVKEPTPGTTTLDDYFTSGLACVYNVNADYVPLSYGYNDSYYYEWYFGDIMSDDALKGGDGVTDGLDAWDIDNFNINFNNSIVTDFYQAQYQGIGRCNMSLEKIPAVACDTIMDQRLKDRLLGEAYFLRAYYYFRLVRLFGGVPIVTTVQNNDAEWRHPRDTKEKVYERIITDLETAEGKLWKKSEYSADDAGHATKGAAQAMLMKVYLYMKNYDKAVEWAAKFETENGGQYSLVTKNNYFSNFTLTGENNCESIFEIQYTEEATSDYGSGNGCTRGTFTQILTRPRNTNVGGWGWNKPTQNLYNEFEDGDVRRDLTIFRDVDEKGQVDEADKYLGCEYNNLKSGWYDVTVDENGFFKSYSPGKLAHQSRGPLNNNEIRYADFILMYAEALLGAGRTGEAQTQLNKLRANRGMPEFPGYKIKINGIGEPVDPTLEQAIRHERRVELAMEGHRWFDLVRWGVAGSVMMAYKAQENPEARAEMKDWNDKFLLMPIPAEEIRLNDGLTQNPGY